LKKIYLIDDDAISLSIVKETIEELGPFDVKTFENTVEGVDAVIKDRPALVLLDLYMPEMKGDQVIVHFSEKKISCDTQVILVTGYGMTEEERSTYMTLGFRTILNKPLAEEDLEVIRGIALNPDYKISA
jgi:CheY-like chemotaxis protein